MGRRRAQVGRRGDGVGGAWAAGLTVRLALLVLSPWDVPGVGRKAASFCSDGCAMSPVFCLPTFR